MALTRPRLRSVCYCLATSFLAVSFWATDSSALPCFSRGPRVIQKQCGLAVGPHCPSEWPPSCQVIAKFELKTDVILDEAALHGNRHVVSSRHCRE